MKDKRIIKTIMGMGREKNVRILDLPSQGLGVINSKIKNTFIMIRKTKICASLVNLPIFHSERKKWADSQKEVQKSNFLAPNLGLFHLYLL
jgi:hypothetical protein